MRHKRWWLVLLTALLLAPQLDASIEQVNLNVEGMT